MIIFAKVLIMETGSCDFSAVFFSVRFNAGPLRSQHTEPFYDEPDRKNYNSYRMYLSSPQGYGDEPYEDEPVHLTPSSPDGYASQSLRFKANTNYVDFYSTTRRPSNRANKFTGSPDSWV